MTARGVTMHAARALANNNGGLGGNNPQDLTLPGLSWPRKNNVALMIGNIY